MTRCYTCKADISERKINGQQAAFCEKCEGARERGELELSSSLSLNDAVARRDIYKKEVDRGVKGRDLIQPYTPDGKFNRDFFHHFGDKAFTEKTQQAEIKRVLG